MKTPVHLAVVFAGALLAGSLLAVGCAGSAKTGGASTQQVGQGKPGACGPVQPIERRSRDPEIGPGVPLGPVQLDLLPFLSGRPLKTYVGTVKQLDTPLILRGWRCSDGVPMRFFFGNELRIDGVVPQDTPTSRRFSVASLERAGHPSAYFKPYPGNEHVNYGGYFIFPTAGKYVLRLYAHKSEIASVVIDTSEWG